MLARSRCSLLVQEVVALAQLNVLSLDPLTVIPAPLAVVSVAPVVVIFVTVPATGVVPPVAVYVTLVLLTILATV